MRVGAFETLSFDCKGNYTVEWTKGKRLTGNFDDFDYYGNKPLYKKFWNHTIIELIHQHYGKFKGRITPFTDNCFKSDNMRRNFKNMTNRLYDKDLLDDPYSFHDMRHFFATNYGATTHDPFTLQTLLGHENINTSSGYVQRVKLKSRRGNWE